MINLNFFVGTAAELIKLYPLIVDARTAGFGVRVLASGQSGDNFLMQYRDFELPEADLTHLLPTSKDLGHASSALRWFARAAIVRPSTFRQKLRLSGNDFVVVHGDTLSTLIGAWLATRAGLTVAHVEAGLRSPSLLNPFPEEITRRLVSRLATLHFVPDARAERNLQQAQVHGRIVNTRGNTLLDAVRMSARLKSTMNAHRNYGLVNVHRFENLNSPTRWATIVDTVVRAAEKNKLIFVAHPQTQAKLEADPETRARLDQANIEVRSRMPFSSFIGLLKDAEFLISDGGSNQEECSYLGKPCLLLRESTERQEGLDGCCLLSRFEPDLIDGFLRNPTAWRRAPLDINQSPTQRILDQFKTGARP